MHTVLFSLKRADQSSIALQRGLLEPFGITPARYDMLFAIRRHGFEFMQQSHLRRRLGVTAATVSKMVRALEALGLVNRKRSIVKDRRQVDVSLTRKGLRLLRKVERCILAPGYLWLAIYSSLSIRHVLDDADAGSLKSFLDRLRAGFRDRATLHFPWCKRTLFPRKPRKLRARHFRLANNT